MYYKNLIKFIFGMNNFEYISEQTTGINILQSPESPGFVFIFVFQSWGIHSTMCTATLNIQNIELSLDNNNKIKNTTNNQQAINIVNTNKFIQVLAQRF